MSVPDRSPLELDAERMRELGYRVVDLLVDRIAHLDAGPTWQGATRAEMAARLRQAPPAGPTEFDEILRSFARDVAPFAGRIDHPRFFAFVPSCPTWPGVLGDFLAAGFNFFQGTWLESAGPSEVELLVLDWFKEWIGYPAEAAGLLLSGGSAANLTALACARLHRLPEGGRGGDGTIYVSAQGHSSMDRAARILGFGGDRIRVIPTDASHRLDLASLREALDADARAGRGPFFVVANAGATSTGAVDALDEIAGICAERAVWLHVDAAYGGFAALTERGRNWLRGMERADSVTLDPHKWLFQPYEAGCLLVREGTRLRDTFHIMPDYLQDTAVGGGAVNFADRGIQLSRTARALKIWISLRYFGVDAFRAAIDSALDLTAAAERRIRESGAFELLSPASLGIVCFRRRPAGVADDAALDRINAELTRRLAESGVGMISSTKVNGRYALRLCIMNHRSQWSDVARVLDWLETQDVA